MGSLEASPFISFLVTTQVTKVPSAPRAAKEARDAAKFWNLEGNMSSLLLRTSFFVRGRRQGRQPLNMFKINVHHSHHHHHPKFQVCPVSYFF